MKTKKSATYFRAKKKVETLKGFYSHLVVYVVVNTILILISANVFGAGKIDFFRWKIYLTPIFWGIGLLAHALYTYFTVYFKNGYLRRWEEKKIQEFLEEDT